MSDNCRFVVAIHAMAYMAHHEEQTCSSEKIAESVSTNAVVIRRLMLQLRDADLVQTIAGRCGGFKLNAKPEEITLDRIYAAVEIGQLIHNPERAPDNDCLMACRLYAVLDQTLSEAQRRFLSHLSSQSLRGVIDQMALPKTA